VPLSKGSSRRAIGGNISEMLHSYGRTGKIGDTKPRNKKHAAKIAAAAAYSKAREGSSGTQKALVKILKRGK